MTTLLAGLAREPSDGDETIQPSSPRLIKALRAIGYSLEAALSDLIDNSINAEAKNVLIRFVSDGQKIDHVVIADDGFGMGENRISEAMRFGTESDLEPASLGKFGLGLKLASLSQARTLTVLTRRAGLSSGRRWTVDGISRGWICEKIAPAVASSVIDHSWAHLDLRSSGTLVIWSEIDRIPVHRSGIEGTIRNIFRRLEIHAGLHLHRFIEDGRLRITLDHQREGEPENEIRTPVQALNPFDYPRSGRDDYPVIFKADIPSVGSISLGAHLWPPNSALPQYKLGRNAAAKQGLYFYRNDRLIQAGGWCGIRQHDSEPHLSLARVKIDLPPSLDQCFGLNVQKSTILVPEPFSQAVNEARTKSGLRFTQYLSHANSLYRRKDQRAERQLPLCPGRGISQRLREETKAALCPDAGRVRPVDFEWAAVPSGGLFELDRSNHTIRLNRDLRHTILGSGAASRADAPLLKLLLFLAFANDLDQKRVPAGRRAALEEISGVLARAARWGPDRTSKK